ncbi:MAG: hypothetical protein JSV44_04470, partial [Candidatus Zixiibacteriota bacterium]
MKTIALIVAAVMALLLIDIPASAYTPDEIRAEIDDALYWLRHKRLPDGNYADDGSWLHDVGITSLLYIAFCNAGRKDLIDFPDDDPRNDAMEYIISNIKPDGSVHSGTNHYKNYHTAVAIMAMYASEDGYTQEILDAQELLLKVQRGLNDDGTIDESDLNGCSGYLAACAGCAVDDNACYGGFGYAPKDQDASNRPDLSNTQFALMGLFPGQPYSSVEYNPFVEAIDFVHHCQKIYDNPYFSGMADGGLIYHPCRSAANEDCGSYGSMTAAGIWAYRLCGVPVNDI